MRWVRLHLKGTLFVIGFSHSLLFDVLNETSLSCEAVCFFFLPKPGLGVAWGQVGGGRLRAMGTLEKPIDSVYWHIDRYGGGGSGGVYQV